MKSNTVPILFNAGNYGTFVEWCLGYFSGSLNDNKPFCNDGSSHSFAGNHLLNMQGWRDYLQSPTSHKLVRLHPKTYEDESLIASALEVLETADVAILMYNNYDSVLLHLNNKFEKIGFLKKQEKFVLHNLEGWDHQSFADMQIWEVREFLSLYIYRQHLSEAEMDDVLAFEHPKLKKIDIRMLFDHFEVTIKQLLEVCQLPVIKNNFDEIYSQWISTQRHHQKDKIVSNIVNAVVNHEYLNWSPLTVVDEAIVQMQLRDLHNLDLRCYNLNVFPTNTTDLQKLLIDV